MPNPFMMTPMSIFGFARITFLVSGVLAFAATVAARATPSDPARFVASIYADGRESVVWAEWLDGARRREWFSSALTALSAAPAIGRLKNSLEGTVVAPGIAAEASRLFARLSQTLRHPSVWKFMRRAAEARALSRHALATSRGSTEPDEIERLNGIVVGSATLGSDLTRARMILQGSSHAAPI